MDSNAAPTLLFADGSLDGALPLTANQQYKSDLVLYSAEAQQIWESGSIHIIAGARFQDGTIKTHNQLDLPDDLTTLLYFPSNTVNQSASDRLEHVSAYGYYIWQPLGAIQLTAGLTYDWITFPKDFRSTAIVGGQQTEDQVSPKAGFIWTPFDKTTLRGAYARSLSGASLEQSFQLEPSQVAGFNQLFRSVIPESVAGANAGAQFDMWDLSLEQKVGRSTYLGLSGQILYSKVDRQPGFFISSSDYITHPFAFPDTTPEHLDYREGSLLATVDQLVGEYFAVGARYQLTEADYRDQFTEAPDALTGRHQQSLLQQVDLHTVFNHPSGFFASFQALWTAQSNDGFAPAEPGDHFWQLNLFAGYRSPRRHLELTVGVLNLTGRDYQLEPLTLYGELPHSRTLMTRLSIDF
jgi:outer membrane receptor protein involved in Fe transport